MGSGKLNDWLQLVGLLGVLGGLMFVGMQLRQDREIASINSVEDASASMFYWAELVADHPKSGPKGCPVKAYQQKNLLLFGHWLERLSCITSPPGTVPGEWSLRNWRIDGLEKPRSTFIRLQDCWNSGGNTRRGWIASEFQGLLAKIGLQL